MNQDCPLCLEPMAIDDVNFFPCECRYQICRFCWHRIRTDEDGRCPHCRLPYSENPAEYTPLTSEQLTSLKEKGRKKNHEKKQKLMESRKSLADVRVVQKNLVFVIGLSPRLADPEILKKQEYFGKYGKIFKVVINHHTVYSGQQGPSVSAYVTYMKTDDASKAIQAVNNAYIDGRYLKASYGTTKYCSFFLRGIQCNKPDCMYLHELGESDASFTKEDMQLGKHQEYEQAALNNGGVSPALTKDYVQYQHQSISSDRVKGSKSKQRPRSVHESALPSSANWGSKGDETDSVERSHSSTSRGHNDSSRSLHRTNSFPVKSSSRDINEGEDRRQESAQDKSPDSTTTESSGSSVDNQEQPRFGTPCSFSSSVESLQSLSPSSGGAGTSCDQASSNGSQQRLKDKENELTVMVDEDEDRDKPIYNSLPMSSESSITHIHKSSLTDHAPSIAMDDSIEKDGANLPVITPRTIGLIETKDTTTLTKEKVVYIDEEESSPPENKDMPPTNDVFRTLGSVGPSDFGSLGVSWQTNDESSRSDPRPSSIDGPEFMPMAWDPLKSSRESSILAKILSGAEGSSSKPREPVDEKERLVSASYVNYGPTTNNGLSEYQAAREMSHGKKKSSDGTAEMLRSTLEDGFKTLFPNIQANPVQQGLQTSQTGLAYPSNQFLTSGLPSTTNHSLDGDRSTEWPDLRTTEKTNKSAVAPPPGFSHPQRRVTHGESVPNVAGATPTSASTNNTYSLWGGNSSNVSGNGVGSQPPSSLQGLFQQQNNTLGSRPSVAKPPPVGAIPATVLEASLLQQQQQQMLANKGYPVGGVAATPTNNLPQQQQPRNMVAAQSMLQHQQQQQLHQMKQLQQQQQIYLQHQLRQQHLMKQAAGVGATPTSGHMGTHPPNGYINQRAFVNPYGGWMGQPHPYGVGVASRPPTMNSYGTVTNSSNVVNPVHWTGQTGLKPVLAGMMSANQQQHAASSGLEQGFQNINLKH